MLNLKKQYEYCFQEEVLDINYLFVGNNAFIAPLIIVRIFTLSTNYCIN